MMILTKKEVPINKQITKVNADHEARTLMVNVVNMSFTYFLNHANNYAV